MKEFVEPLTFIGGGLRKGNICTDGSGLYNDCDDGCGDYNGCFPGDNVNGCEAGDDWPPPIK